MTFMTDTSMVRSLNKSTSLHQKVATHKPVLMLWTQGEQCSKPLLFDDYVGLYNGGPTR